MFLCRVFPSAVEGFVEEAQDPVVQKPISTNPRLKLNQGVYFFTPKVLFNADIRQNFTLKEVNFEKKKK